jgi:hypothetical protein
MRKFEIKLTIKTDNGDPNEWNWHELVGVELDEDMFVEVEELTDEAN